MVDSFGTAGLGAIGRVLRLMMAAVLLVVFAACAPTYENHGYMPSDDELS